MLLRFSSVIYLFLFSVLCVAETLQVSGPTVNDALRTALSLATRKYIKIEPAIRDAILVEEILPKAAQFVSSYKMLGGNSTGGYVSVSTDVDVSALRSVYGFNSRSLGFDKTPKILLVTKGFSGGSAWEGIAYSDVDTNFAKMLEALAVSSFSRRKFEIISKYEGSLVRIGNISESLAKEILQILASNTQAQYVFGVETKFDDFVNDEGQHQGQHLILKAALFSAKQNAIIASFQTHIPMAAGERAIITHAADEKIKDQISFLLLNIFTQAGKIESSAEGVGDPGIVLRVLNPPSNQAINELRLGIESLKSVESIVERRIKHGEFDFKVETNLGLSGLERELQKLNLENFTVSVQPSRKSPDTVRMAVVKLAANKKDK